MTSGAPTKGRRLGDAVRLGLAVLALRQVAIQGVNVVAAVVLARVLDPSDFGVYSVVLAITVAVTAFGDFGFAAALLQRGARPTARDVARNMTMTAAATTGLVLVFAAACTAVHLIAPDVLDVRVLALAITAAAASLWWAPRAAMVVQHEADLRYGKVSAVDLVEVLGFQIASVLIALAGGGAWSFVIALHVRSVLGVLVLLFVTPIRPRFTRDLAGMGHDLRFGITFQFGWMAHSASTLALPLAVAPGAGTYGLGIYLNAASNATRLNVVVDLMSRIALPSLARAHSAPARRTPPERTFLLVACTVLLGWTAFVVSEAHELVVVVFGEKWEPSVVLLQVLVLGSVFAAVTSICGTALASRGRPGQQAWIFSLRLVLMFPALLAGAAVADLQGVAVASVVVDVLGAVFGLTLLGRAVWWWFLRDLLLLLPAVAGVLAANAVLPDIGGVGGLLLHAAVSAAVFTALALACSGALREQVVSAVRLVRRPREVQPEAPVEAVIATAEPVHTKDTTLSGPSGT